MEGKVTLEVLELQLTNDKIDDLTKKMEIAANVLMKSEIHPYPKNKGSIHKTAHLTGVSADTVGRIAKMEQKSKQFGHWIKEERQKIHRHHFAYLSLRNHLIENYTKQFQIPTKLSNNSACEGYKQFCLSLPLPGTKKAITVEKPETALERHRFLYTKMTHKEAGRHIVYIGKIILQAFKGKFSYKEDNMEFRNGFLIAVSPNFGCYGHLYCSRKKYAENFLANWILEQIEPELPRGSVIIFQENVLRLADEAVDRHSSKQEMMDWLNSRNIPHESTQHRAELYRLIKLNNNIRTFAPAEDILMARGHITMRKTKCNLDNNYFDPFWTLLMNDLNVKNITGMPLRLYSYTDMIDGTANATVGKCNQSGFWKDIDDTLLEKEREIYREDLEMEHIIDKLMTMAKNGDLPGDAKELKLDKYSKQLEEEHFVLCPSLTGLFSEMSTLQAPTLNKTKL